MVLLEKRVKNKYLFFYYITLKIKFWTTFFNKTSPTTVSSCTATDSTVTTSRDAGQLFGATPTDKVINCSATNVEVNWNDLGTGANIRNEIIGRIL